MIYNIKKEASGSLTKVLEEVQLNLEEIQADIGEVVRDIENNKEKLVAQSLSGLQAQEPIKDQDSEISMREMLIGDIDESIAELNRSHNHLGRFIAVIRGSGDISRKLEKTWWGKLMSVLKDTKWYREHFPAQYEEDRRRKEYEHYRLRPETLYKKDFEPEEEIKVSSLRLKKRATFDIETVAQQLQDIHNRVLHVYQQYFSADSSILEHSNALLKKVRNMEMKEKDRTTRSALSDQVQMVENLFGVDTQPGRLISLGGNAFLMPSAHALQKAMTKIQELLFQSTLTPSALKDIEQNFQQKKDFREKQDELSKAEDLEFLREKQEAARQLKIKQKQWEEVDYPRMKAEMKAQREQEELDYLKEHGHPKKLPIPATTEEWEQRLEWIIERQKKEAEQKEAEQKEEEAWKQYLQEQREEEQQKPSQQARKNIALERLGIKVRQQKRCKLVQRITSSS